MLSGSVLAQLIAVAALPYLSRVYSVEAFGKFQLYMSALNVLLMLVAFRYEVALLSSKTSAHFRSLIKLVIRLCLIVSLSIMVFVLFTHEIIGRYNDDLVSIIYILPIAVFVAGIYQMLTYLPIRERNYYLSSKTKVVQSAVYTGAAIMIAHTPFSLLGLIFADIVSRAAASLNIFRGIDKKAKIYFGRVNSRSFKLALCKYKEYPMFTFPGTLLSALVGAIVPYVLLLMFDLTVAGQYALVDRFILLPVGIVSAAISQVFTGDFAEKVRQVHENLNSTYRKTVLALAAVAIIPTVIVYHYAPVLVTFIFGEQWGLAGELCAVAVPIAFIRFVVGPVNMVLIICREQKLQLAWEILRFVITVILFFYLYHFKSDDPVAIISYYAASVVASYVIYLIIADIVTKKG